MTETTPPLRWRAYLAEASASFVFAFLVTSAFAVTAFMGATGTSGILALALMHGAAFAGALAFARPISGGHVNPALTLGALIAGRIPGHDALAYIVAQLVGGALGVLFAAQLMPVEAITATQHGAVLLAPGVETGRALGLALVATTCVAFVWHALDRRKGSRRGLEEGAALAVSVFVTAPLLVGATNIATIIGAGALAEWPDGTWPVAIGSGLGGVLAASLWRFFDQPDA